MKTDLHSQDLMKSLAGILVLAVVLLSNGYGVGFVSHGAELDAVETLRIEDELIRRLDDIEQGLPPQKAEEKLFDPQSCEEIDDLMIPQDILLKIHLLEDQEVECVYKMLFAQALQRQRANQETAMADAVPTLQPSPILWNGNSCGCVPAVNHVVYGLYPVEMANAEEQRIDFSVISRIGYASLTFDENGKIEDRVHWKKEKPHSNFINEAHRYRSKVDLVIYNKQWGKWGNFPPEETSVIFDKLSANIVNLVNVKLNNDWLNILKPYISFGYSPTRTMGDGVTINFNFDGIQNKNPQKIFPSLYAFVNRLRDRLDQTGEPFFLNMMIPLRDVFQNDGMYHLNNLRKLSDDVNFFLVVIHEPIEDQMKVLRAKIEEQFSNIEQQTLVRKMIPVLSPDVTVDRLRDGLVYMEDNFGGVGLSAIPVVKEGQVNPVNQALKRFLHFEDGSICQYVCSYRWILRTIIFCIGIFGIGYGVLAIGIYELRTFYAQHSGYFVGGAFLTMIPLVFTFSCDPFWKDRQSELLLLALIIGGGILIWKLQQRKEWTYP